MPKAKETGAASAPAKKTAGRRSYRSYGKIKPAPGKSKAEPKPIKVSFLGGLNEVGKNMTLFEYGEDMFLVDCGLAFPDRICSESISCFPISPMSSATRTEYAE